MNRIKTMLVKRGSTHFLRFVITILCLAVLALCVFALPGAWKGGSAEFPMASYAVILIVIGLYATAIPFYIGAWQTLKLLKYIDQSQVFSELSVRALRNIKRCAGVIALLYVGGVPLLFPIADADDAPGLLIFGALIACFPVAATVFTAVLQRLLQSAIDMKSENDLTV